MASSVIIEGVVDIDPLIFWSTTVEVSVVRPAQVDNAIYTWSWTCVSMKYK